MKLKLLLATVLATSMVSFATEKCPVKDLDSVKKKAEEKFFEGKVKIKSISPAPVNGLYQITVEFGDMADILYTDCDLKYVIQGRILDPEKRVDLTMEERTKLMKEVFAKKEEELTKVLGKDKVEKLKKEGLIQMISVINTTNLPKANISYGNGDKVVYVFTDPECPFCANLHKEIEKLLSKRKDVKVEMVLLPLPMHKHAEGIAENILCQNDNKARLDIISKSFESVLKGDEKGLSGLEKSCPSGKEVIDKNTEFAMKVGINGTPTIVFPNKGLKIVGIIPSEKLDTLIDIVYGK